MKESVAIAKDAAAKKEFSPTRSGNSIHRVRNAPERQLGSLRDVIGNITRDGGTPSANSIATELSSMHTAQRTSVLLALQRTHGNRYVQRVVAGIQAKLKVGQSGDIYEEEADRVAEQVMQMPEPQVQRQPEEGEEEELIQTKPLADPITPLIQRQVEEKEEEEEILQTKENPSQTPEVRPDLESHIQSLKGGGQPLSASTRAFFEPRFGYDFSQVRAHTGVRSAESARAVNAQAFTIGQDVVFGTGQYAPETTAGKRLLAHELTHVVQQSEITSPPLIQYRDEPGVPTPPAGAIPPPAGAPRPIAGRPSPETRSPQRVLVVDFGVNRDVFNWRECIFHIGEIEAESVDQMVRDVRTRVGDPAQNCISRLTLNGHGSPGSISVGDGTGWVDGRCISAGNFRQSLAELTPYFCDGATVVLFGCNVGRGATGVRFIQALSDFWQVNVAAPTGVVNGFGIMGVWVWGIPGQVLPNDTMLIVDQIVRILDERTYGDDEEMIFDLLEAGNSRGILNDIMIELVRQGRWNSLRSDLRDEDESRYDRLFPMESGLALVRVDGNGPIDLGVETHFEVRPAPRRRGSLGYRWVIEDLSDNRYLMWGSEGQVFRFGHQYHAYIPSRTRALLRQRNITQATILCRVQGAGREVLLSLSVTFTPSTE